MVVTWDLGLGWTYARADALGSLAFAATLHYRHYGASFQVHAHDQLIGRGHFWQVGGVGRFLLADWLSLGSGVAYVSESYTSQTTYDLVFANRFGVPLEVMLRLRGPGSTTPFVLGFVALNESTFGGLVVGVSF